jgi:hypothetical protein
MKQDLFTTNIVDINTNGGYSYEQILNNKNCSKDPKYWWLIEKTSLSETPRYLFKSDVAESWEFWDKDIMNPVRNSNLIYLRFLDVSEFMKPSSTFKVEKRYCNFAPDSIGWNKYWDDLEDKVENGFEVEGVRITGRHFFLINFGRFRAIPTDENGNQTNKKKIWTFLRFLDHQYYMMMELEECLLEGPYSLWEKFKSWFLLKNHSYYDTLSLENFALAKGRRKGWTAQIAIGIFSYNFTFIESSMNILAAYEKSHYGAMLKAIHTTKSFLDANTPWIRRTEIKGTYENFKASVEVVKEDGRRIEEGYLSEITAASFKDNSFKTIGESASVINLEEAGRFPNILEAYQVSVEPLIRDGETSVGISIVGGTAGDMESGGSYGLSEIIYKPNAYGFKEYDNIYEPQDIPGKSGWFIDDMWYLPLKVLKSEILEINSSDKTKELLNKFEDDYIDCVDKQGNSYRYFAELVIDKKRNDKKKISSIAYQKFITQQPKYLSEAFLLDTNSPFDTVLAKEVLGELSVSEIGEEKGLFTILSTGKIEFKLNMRLNSIDEYPFKGDDTTGCWVIYEKPQYINGEIPYWRYIAGNDPIDWGSDEVSTDGSHSFAAAYILDTITRNIVAEYIARPKNAEDFFEQLWRGLEYYNALLLYENNLKSLFSYFKLKNKLYLLAKEPELLKNRLGYKASGRIYGFHATPASNSTGRDFINTWTLEQVQVGQTEDGEPIFLPRMYFIKSKALLQEIIGWNNKGNFDRISALGALMLLLFDRNYDTLDQGKEEKNILQSGLFRTIRDRIERRNMKFKFKSYINGN